jgi:Flp pilus assembly CpaE family ATPase
VTDVLANVDRLDPVLLESYVTTEKGLAVLPGARDFRSGQQLTKDAIDTLLEVARQAYAHVIVDLPGFHSEEILDSMVHVSQDILIVLTPELPAVWRTHRLLSYLETILNPEALNPKMHLVLNRADSRTELTYSDIEKTLERSIKWKLSDDFSAAIEAINSGTPLVSLNHSGLASDYENLAQGLTGVSRAKRRGFLGLFPN